VGVVVASMLRSPLGSLSGSNGHGRLLVFVGGVLPTAIA
jgi:hypothetical protein